MKRPTIAALAGRVFDVILIGGGATGAAAARDAALRGLSVLLLEKNDFASGTSSRSTKLLHGGLRYLERFEFGLVREACRERELMMSLAPHLCTPRPFLYLQYEGYPEGMLKLRAGLTIYDLFSGNPLRRRHHMVGRRELLALEPHLNPEGLKGAGYYYDFLTDDARFTIETVKGACEAGAIAANHMEVTGFLNPDGRIAGVRVRDHLTGDSGQIQARQVINTAGPWVDSVRFLEEGVEQGRLRPTKGIHIVLRKSDFPLNHAVFLRHPRDNRVVWPIPALNSDLIYIGTTDTDYGGSPDQVTATPEDVDYLLEVANHVIPGHYLGPAHVVATWAGLRPLIAPEDARDASAVSREHEIFVSPHGLLTIGGGKLTTARVMGRDVIDRAAKLLGRHHGIRDVPPSTSERVPLSGGDPAQLWRARRVAQELALDPAVRARLLQQYGANFLKLAEMVRADEALAHPLGAPPVTPVEVRYTVEEEMCHTLSDFFTRRATLFYWLEDGGLSLAPAVAAEMGALLGWDAEETERQLADYAAWVSANRTASVAAGIAAPERLPGAGN